MNKEENMVKKKKKDWRSRVRKVRFGIYSRNLSFILEVR